MAILNYDALKTANLKDPKVARQLTQAVDAFLAGPEHPLVLKAAMQHFTTPDDYPDQAKMIAQVFQDTPTYDEGWRRIYTVYDSNMLAGRSNFNIDTVAHSTVVRKVQMGDRIEVYKTTGSSTQITFDTYGAALGWQEEWFEDAEYYRLERALMEFRDKHYQKRADTAYGLLEAIPSTYNTSWQNPVPAALANTDPNYTAIRDMVTISKGCENVITNCLNTAIQANMQSTFLLVAPYQLRDRVLRGLGLLNQSLAGPMVGVHFRVEPIFTTHFSASTSYYIGVPGQKSVWGNRKELAIKGPVDDILANAQHMSAWMRYGGAIADTRQWTRCATS